MFEEIEGGHGSEDKVNRSNISQKIASFTVESILPQSIAPALSNIDHINVCEKPNQFWRTGKWIRPVLKQLHNLGNEEILDDTPKML